MKKVKVGFSKNRHDAIFSIGLQKYMKTTYSHTFVEFDTKDSLGDDSIYHSSLSTGIGYMSKSNFEKDNEIMYTFELELSDEIYDDIRRSLFSVCGQKYGLSQNIGILIVDLCKKCGIIIGNPFPSSENCSEMLYRHVILEAYSEYKGEFDPNTITPLDIFNIVSIKGRRL